MRFGLGVLRLSSHEFWALTPRELAAAMPHPTNAQHAPSAAALAALMAQFPDRKPAEEVTP
jgi:uncharacterized phage protein (TIGR02216 family)